MEMVKWIFKVRFFFVVVECGGDARRAVAMILCGGSVLTPFCQKGP